MHRCYDHRLFADPEGNGMSVEHTIRSYIQDEIMRGRDERTTLEDPGAWP